MTNQNFGILIATADGKCKAVCQNELRLQLKNLHHAESNLTFLFKWICPLHHPLPVTLGKVLIS